MKKEPPDLKLVVTQAVSSPERREVAKNMRALLEGSGVIGLFDTLKASGFTIISTEPDKPGLKITAKKSTPDKFKPLSFTLVLTQSEERGANQPDIDCYSHDRLGSLRLTQLIDIPAEIHRWVFNNLPRITQSPEKGKPGPGAHI